jgi:hypothetical protein
MREIIAIRLPNLSELAAVSAVTAGHSQILRNEAQRHEQSGRICAGQGDNKSGAARPLIDLSCNRIAAWDLRAGKSFPMSDDGADMEEAKRNRKSLLRGPVVRPMPRITFLPGD